jgi:hypothetical protein
MHEKESDRLHVGYAKSAPGNYKTAY